MADVMLDQFSFTLPAESNIVTWDRSSPVPRWGSPNSPLWVIDDRRRGPGASRDDAISISSDEESDDSDEFCEPDKPDGGDLGDGQSDVFVPPGEVSTANNDKESGGVTGRDHNFSASFGIGGDGDAPEMSTVKGSELDNEALDTEHSPEPPFPPGSPERRSASAEPIQLAQDRPTPVNNIHAPGSGSRSPLPEAATCDEEAKWLSSVSPAGGEGLPSSRSLSGLCSPGLEDHSGRDGIPRRRVDVRQKVSGNDSDGETETPRAKRRPSRTMAAVRCESRHASSTSSVNSNGKNEDGQQSDTQGNLQTSPGSRRHDHGGDDAYHPRDTGSDQDGDARLPPRKRRRKSPPASTPRRAAKKHLTVSHCSDRRRRQVRRPSPCQKRRTRHSNPSPPPSHVEAHSAGFEQWQLQNAVLKRVTVNGKATFQFEFSWDPCVEHKRKDGSRWQQRRPPAERRHLGGQSPTSTTDAPTPTDEEEWEVQLILASRIHCEELQYQVKWANLEDDQEWYYADGFKKSPHLLKRYHSDHPEMPGPPVRLEQWLRAYENGAEDDDHPDDNKPLRDGSD